MFGPHESLTSEILKNALLAASSTSSDIFPCQYWVGTNKAKWYNLKPLQKKDGDYYDVNGHDGEQILFNLCGAFSAQKAQPKCKDSDRYAYLLKTDGTCDSLTASDEDEGEVVFHEIVDDDKKATGVSFTFKGSDDQCDGGQYGLKVFITCDKDMTTGEIKDLKFLRSTPNTCV